MALCIVTDDHPARLGVVPFTNERELEDIVADNPYLLTEDDEDDLMFVARQVNLPDAGQADLVFVNGDGLITLVEVKLGRNGQSRREVVGQVFDYVSTLADLTYVEVDERTGGALDRALRQIADDDARYEALRKTCSTELRAGKVRVSVVTDAAPESLVRIMSYMNDHSDLDVRLIAVHKHKRDGVVVFAPQSLVVAQEDKAVARRPQGPVDEGLAAAVAAFDRGNAVGLTTLARSSARRYRQVRIPGWHDRYHYEFTVVGDGVAAEFHPEIKDLGPMADVFGALVPSVEAALPASEVTVIPDRWEGLGALRVTFPDGSPPETVAAGMATLIETTLEPLAEAYRARRSHGDGGVA
jgi:hypothetical protein